MQSWHEDTIAQIVSSYLSNGFRLPCSKKAKEVNFYIAQFMPEDCGTGECENGDAGEFQTFFFQYFKGEKVKNESKSSSFQVAGLKALK